ncbi:unnamed protein product, partial [Mesorhabditis belari]|uniref:Lipocalin/cytosolic fatty-acid binding domain-containing protein n=1 Tax=Mesorhabditis belari TaxID=2138241 RepID=A0AAF3FKX3_9BILA
MSVDQFAGTWVQSSQEKFEEYMKEAGVGLITRKAAANLKVTCKITVEGNTVHWRQESSLKNYELTFTVGEDMEEETADGRHFKTNFHWVGDKLVQEQTPIKDGDKPSTISRWVQGNELHIEMVCGSVTAKRVYTKQ